MASRLRRLALHVCASPDGQAATTGTPTAGDRGDDASTEFEAVVGQLSGLIEAKMAEYRTTGVAFGICKRGASVCRGFGACRAPQRPRWDRIGGWGDCG